MAETATNAAPPLPPPPRAEPPPRVDPLVRMQAELKRAAAKPADQRRWVMVLDLRKCVGCSACTVGCVAENKLPPGVVYRPVVQEEKGTYPHVSRRAVPRPCMQCDQPPCVPVCPVKATSKSASGIVRIDYDKCIGCRACLTACPYSARSFDAGRHYLDGTPRVAPGEIGARAAGAYERTPAFEYGVARARKGGKSPVGKARKCHFCEHRLAAGILPACATTCIGRATYFGDANDPETLVARLMALPKVLRLKEEMGTKPRVFYAL
jgi:Fe-S-cluster-containing dehydrogenase component